MRGKKGVSGKILTVILTLVIALIALILLWTFLTKATPLISNAIENTISGFKNMLCEKFGAASLICKLLIGE